MKYDFAWMKKHPFKESYMEIPYVIHELFFDTYKLKPASVNLDSELLVQGQIKEILWDKTYYVSKNKYGKVIRGKRLVLYYTLRNREVALDSSGKIQPREFPFDVYLGFQFFHAYNGKENIIQDETYTNLISWCSIPRVVYLYQELYFDLYLSQMKLKKEDSLWMNRKDLYRWCVDYTDDMAKALKTDFDLKHNI